MIRLLCSPTLAGRNDRSALLSLMDVFDDVFGVYATKHVIFAFVTGNRDDSRLWYGVRTSA
jgi:hypothetical protein